MTEILDIFKLELPEKPYCTDDLNFGLKIRPAEIALKRRYIQYNKPTDLRWFVYDIDRPTAIYDWEDVHAPPPNFAVMNPTNGHGHLFYGLEIPVYTQTTAKKNPIRFASAIDVAMIEKLQADAGFAELISKNPLHPSWNTSIFRNESYDLAELADWLPMEKYSDARKPLPPIGLGRNCTMFDKVRFWAYREIRKPTETCLFEEMNTREDFISRCIEHARKVNRQFEKPLPDSEPKATGRSVGKWVYTNMSPQGFQDWADNRRAKSAVVRGVQSKAQKIQAQQLFEDGYTARKIAEIMNLSKMQIIRYLSD